MTLSYIIANLRLCIDIPDHLAGLIPASFAPFRASADGDAAIRIKIRPAAASPNPHTYLVGSRHASTASPTRRAHTNSLALLDQTTNDLGTVALYQIPSGYFFTLKSGESAGETCLAPTKSGMEASHTKSGMEASHTKYGMETSRAAMVAAEDFSTVEIFIDPSSPNASAAINSLTRIAFSQMVLLHGGISIHASAVVSAGRAILFLGSSGTGKSTHARLWTDTIPATTLLNDDNPIIRITDSSGETCLAPTKFGGFPSNSGEKMQFGGEAGVCAYGSPWSGKTPCHLNRRAPLKAIVRLRQSSENHFIPLTDIDAFINLLPSCSAIKTSALLHDAMIDTLQRIILLTDNGLLHCRPDPQAALICHSALFFGNSGKFTP